ncbi:MAG: hypothetical protein Q7T74_04290 [Candidatus Saccharibacteria bacterium]|nr:hypothetical protein [Candidatus Saccharibacteria bacterium]
MAITRKPLNVIMIAASIFSLTLLPVSNVLAIENTSTTTSSSPTATQTNTKEAAAKQARAKAEATKSATKTEAKTTSSAASNCQSINKIADTIQAQLAEKKSNVDSKRIDVHTKSATYREARSTELQSKREGWDAKRQQNFDKLQSIAKTDMQKQAVETYVSAMTEAIKVRRAANDTAFTAFKSDIDNLKKTTVLSVDSNISTTTASINQAISDAKAACTAGQSVDTVRQKLKTAIATARQQAKTSRESTSKGEQLKIIVQKHNDAVKANDEAFKAATTAARAQLKTVFEQQ